MPLPNSEGFDHKLHENVDVTQGSNKVHVLLTPEEAAHLLDLVERSSIDTPSSIKEEAMLERLQYGADGLDGPTSGDARYYT